MLRTTIAVAALACSLGACGVGAQSQPKAIDASDVPFGLARHDRATPTTRPDAGSWRYDLYFVADGRVRAVTRTAANPPTLTAMLRALARGPDATETEAGVRTALGPDVSVQRVTVHDGVATVTLAGLEAPRAASDEQALAIAQLVYTATGVPTVERVRFEVDGRPVDVPRADGSLSSRPVDRADYPTPPA
jgi:spore germination protein GerM